MSQLPARDILPPNIYPGPALPVEEATYYVEKSRQVALLTSAATQKLAMALSQTISVKRKSSLPCLVVGDHLQSSPSRPADIHISSGRYLDDNDAGIVSEYNLLIEIAVLADGERSSRPVPPVHQRGP